MAASRQIEQPFNEQAGCHNFNHDELRIRQDDQPVIAIHDEHPRLCSTTVINNTGFCV